MNIFKRFIFIVLALVFAASFDGCSKFAQSKSQEHARRKQFERDKKKKDQAAQQAYEDAIRRNYGMQTKSTQRMMKQTARTSFAAKNNKKPNFLQRWFAPKQKRAKTNRNVK